MRAATPSNAAEIVVPDQNAIRQNMDSMSIAMVSALQKQIKNARRHLAMISASPSLQSPDMYISQRKKELQVFCDRLVGLEKDIINKNRRRYLTNIAKLDAMSPLKVITRGYAIAQTEDKRIVRSIVDVNPGESIYVRLNDGEIIADVESVRGLNYEAEQ